MSAASSASSVMPSVIPSVILVPGLRGSAPDHWQEHLARETGAVHLRTDRAPLDLVARVHDLQDAVAAAGGPVVLVAHSAGVLTLLHWAAGHGSVELATAEVGVAGRGTADRGDGRGSAATPADPTAARRGSAASAAPSVDRVAGALLVTPPTLTEELPPVYPRRAELAGHGWLPLPVAPLPFPARVGASTTDPLGPVEQVRALAECWGADVLDLGDVGHANPASGLGRWPGLAAIVDSVVAVWLAGAAEPTGAARPSHAAHPTDAVARADALTGVGS